MNFNQLVAHNPISELIIEDIDAKWSEYIHIQYFCDHIFNKDCRVEFMLANYDSWIELQIRGTIAYIEICSGQFKIHRTIDERIKCGGAGQLFDLHKTDPNELIKIIDDCINKKLFGGVHEQNIITNFNKA